MVFAVDSPDMCVCVCVSGTSNVNHKVAIVPGKLQEIGGDGALHEIVHATWQPRNQSDIQSSILKDKFLLTLTDLHVFAHCSLLISNQVDNVLEKL